MICTKCNCKTKVADSYTDDNFTYRRYKCPKCGKQMYTTEAEDYAETVNAMLYKKPRKGKKQGE